MFPRKHQIFEFHPHPPPPKKTPNYGSMGGGACKITEFIRITVGQQVSVSYT